MSITQQEKTATAVAIGAEWPGLKGSAYAGIARGANGSPDYHLVLLADKPASELNWKDALDWAKRIDADVPTRDESALLYAHLRDQFEAGWHWSSTQYSSSYAWDQYFTGGFQGISGKKAEARARAVRRFNTSVLQSFEVAGAPTPSSTELLTQILAEIKAGRADIEKIFLADIGAGAAA